MVVAETLQCAMSKAAGAFASKFLAVIAFKGDMTMTELVKKSGKTVSGRAILGMTSDIRAMKIGLNRPGGGGLNYDCGDLACICFGDDDCANLFFSSNCGP